MIHNKKNNTSSEESIETERCPYKGYTYFVPRKANSGNTAEVKDLLGFCTESYKMIDCSKWVDSFSECGYSYLENRCNHTLMLYGLAESLLKTAIADAVIHKDRYFGNARWINQFILSGILPAMARRVIQNGMPMNVEAFRTIEASDVEHATRKFVKPASPHLRPHRKIGFIA